MGLHDKSFPAAESPEVGAAARGKRMSAGDHGAVGDREAMLSEIAKSIVVHLSIESIR